jgi:hypothetical protein
MGCRCDLEVGTHDVVCDPWSKDARRVVLPIRASASAVCVIMSVAKARQFGVLCLKGSASRPQNAALRVTRQSIALIIDRWVSRAQSAFSHTSYYHSAMFEATRGGRRVPQTPEVIRLTELFYRNQRRSRRIQMVRRQSRQRP